MGMGIDIHSKVAKPQLFFWGAPKVFVANIAIVLLCLITGRLLTGIAVLVIGTLVAAIIAYYKAFFFEERYLPLKHKIKGKKFFKKEDFYV